MGPQSRGGWGSGVAIWTEQCWELGLIGSKLGLMVEINLWKIDAAITKGKNVHCI